MGRTEAVGKNARVAGVALLCLGLIAAVGAASSDLVDAKKKKDRRVGTYRGTIDADDALGVGGGTISFRFTRNRKIAGFTAADIPLLCDPQDQFGTAYPTTPKGTVTFSVPTTPVQGAARFLYRTHPWDTGNNPVPGPFTYIEVQGKPAQSGKRTEWQGYLIYLSGTATADRDKRVPGTVTCASYKAEWTAEKVGGKKK